ncbi:FAD-dependent monooxygenase [Streptomyces sp. MK37H]|uniref:FAD-dependent monooxygenase n=1 Tax=Streptomyces sp. MK37H TaxID=2699117 RepID=UPI001B3887CF|nr:FAD-dependent monooxygenase [Streptomyces sp. MK37H]MBP8538443.1 FAD-dependent oxidoreductase [Streptomyces sp. MK37H]
MNTDVVVAGGGPVGLLLAAELRLAGVSVTLLERLTEPSQAIKAGGINGRSTQLLARRGLRARLEAESAQHGDGFAAFAGGRSAEPAAAGGDTGARPPSRFNGHFAGLFLHPGPELDVPAGTVMPQQTLERLLGAWVAELGVQVLRGHAIMGFTQDAEGVTVRAATGDGEEVRVRGGYLVGCDGGRSTVRKLAGFDFPGTEPLTTGYQAIVTLDAPERLPLGWNLTGTGLCAHGPRAGRLLTVAFDGPPANRDAEITVAELQDNLRHVSGRDVGITAIQAATRFTDNTRQAATYRKGRVLLAGDAAHVHPPFGGQGLNLGLQDAANLGWKLAATVQGWAPDGLLDTYTTERHPVAARVLANTRAQIAIMRPDAHSRAMRELFGELIPATGMTERLVSMVQGLDIRYEMGAGAHPLTGGHVPDALELEDAMRLPRPVLFGAVGSATLRAAVDGWTDRVDVRPPHRSAGPAALLVRPDGYVAWAADRDPDTSDVDALRRALRRWCGDPLR